MSKLGIYLAYDNAKEAMQYYEENFGTKTLEQKPLTKEIAQMVNMEPINLENTTYSGCFQLNDISFRCSDRIDNNGEFTQAFNIMIECSKKEDEEFYYSMVKRLRDNKTGVVLFDSEKETGSSPDMNMFRFKDTYGLTWSFVLD